MKNIAIIGAGPMGLMSALHLLRLGYEVDIYERDDRIGGMSASFDFDGTAIERYYHFVCKTDFHLFRLLAELGISDRLKWVDTKMGFYCDGKLYRWGTLGGLLAFDKLDWISKLRYALHVMRTKSIRDWTALDQVGAIPWLKKWLGVRGYEVLWQRLFELKFYEYSNRLSAAWLGTRIKRVALSRRNLLQESLGYLEGGSAVLLERMRQAISSAGGQIHLKAGIERVVTDGGSRVTGVYVDGHPRPVTAVISTVPIPYVPQLVPDLPPSFTAQIRAIENIPVVCVVLKLRHAVSENFWMNICDKDIEIPGVIEYSNLNPVGTHILYAPFYMPKTHPKYTRPNAEFIREVVEYLPKLNPSFEPDWILATHCHRYEYAQTVCPPGFFSMLPAMQTPIAGFYMADTGYYYPEDRSISESINVGTQLANATHAWMSKAIPSNTPE